MHCFRSLIFFFQAYPLDMSQYKNLFNTSRIPMMETDKIYSDFLTRHIVVIKDGNFYKLDVLDESGQMHCYYYILIYTLPF